MIDTETLATRVSAFVEIPQSLHFSWTTSKGVLTLHFFPRWGEGRVVGPQIGGSWIILFLQAGDGGRQVNHRKVGPYSGRSAWTELES